MVNFLQIAAVISDVSFDRASRAVLMTSACFRYSAGVLVVTIVRACSRGPTPTYALPSAAAVVVAWVLVLSAMSLSPSGS